MEPDAMILVFWMLSFTLQYCSGFCHTLTRISHGCTFVPHSETPPNSLLIPSLWVILVHQPWAPCLMSRTWTGDLHITIHMFQCYSLKSSHPRLLLQRPKDCSIHVCLFCCLTYRVIITIFLNSIYMCQYTVLVFFFLTYFTLYNRLQFHPPH